MSIKSKVLAAAATLTLVGGGDTVVRQLLHQHLQPPVRHPQVAELRG